MYAEDRRNILKRLLIVRGAGEANTPALGLEMDELGK